jgi:hypothetical protein
VTFSWAAAAITVVVLIAAYSSPYLTFGSYFALAAWATVSPTAAIKALTVAWLIGFLNPVLFEPVEHYETVRWLPVVTAFLGAIIRSARRRTKPGLEAQAVIYLGTLYVGISLYTSYAPVVSLAKIGTFTSGALAVLINFRLAHSDGAVFRWHIQRWFATFTTTVVMLSAPFFFSDAGFHLNERGFQGLMSHPQAFGVFLAPIVAWGSMSLLMRMERPRPVVYTLILAWASLLATQSRTALLAVLGGLLIAGLVGVISRHRAELSRRGLAIAALLGVVVLVATEEELPRAFVTFLKKDSGASVVESLQRSRWDLTERSLSNFQTAYLTGIGFGMPSDTSELNVQEWQALSVPVGASIEKGFLLSAVLEEVGIIGLIALLVLLGVLCQVAWNHARLHGLCVLLVCIFVNLGEAVFFSFGGMGLYTWLLMGFAATACRIDDLGDRKLERSFV